MKEQIKLICFDADDTLWVNEPYYREIEKRFSALMKEFIDEDACQEELLKIEINNIGLYGYGAKSFMLSMIETALKISDHKINQSKIGQILELGNELINKPVELLDGVENVLKSLKDKYRLIVATKGDLLDQERKLDKSGLEQYFHHIEIMSEKEPANYKKLIAHLDIPVGQFLMVGNSVKSDILPVLEIGGHAIHIPCETTWAHEHVENHSTSNPRFQKVNSISEITGLLL
ncbi:MAG: HAD family hydrolase [Calditrichaeota bacterium]|nr:MAG: HAD family hydrolase [Calditrichota bacterium]MBL1206434.1 HAD family hydrolase [Calditrichota bacterium]NOG46261.1 HAD family hydrolase [Calditrichota bacterium]